MKKRFEKRFEDYLVNGDNIVTVREELLYSAVKDYAKEQGFLITATCGDAYRGRTFRLRYITKIEKYSFSVDLDNLKIIANEENKDTRELCEFLTDKKREELQEIIKKNCKNKFIEFIDCLTYRDFVVNVHIVDTFSDEICFEIEKDKEYKNNYSNAHVLCRVILEEMSKIDKKNHIDFLRNYINEILNDQE